MPDSTNNINKMYDTDKTFLLRIPRTLHAELKEKASRTLKENDRPMSLHQYILTVLARDVNGPEGI
ncbi:MAG: hypothetical protein M0P30_07475 [Syntrophorhabdaceae bacterium]|nr:hypothetical protein [Syntrophorhabdaceae bacterium]HOC45038.1 hypothetical protein [Syntrophorhabdaceae bacterium]